ncbi:MAG TPA: ATP-binding protein [Candidatus Lokiarchaeia archaeon]|nr:ATP-binding protein [Candidatus Lokiarchaeia archaeon]
MTFSFIDRERELDALLHVLTSDRFELVVLYGRRRVGKTELIKQSVQGYTHLYYLAIEENNLERFYELCVEIDPELRHYQHDYESLFDALKTRVQIVIIDEFQNLIRENPGIISLLQSIIDTSLKDSRLKIFLLGSSISIIQARVLDYASPLFGRRTASFLLAPMRFADIAGFFPGASVESLVEIYGFADGIPAYLKEVELPFWPWLLDNLMSLKNLFRDEVDFLLRYEFSSPVVHRQILDAIAHGKTKLNEIKQAMGVKRTDITPYLRNLIDTGLVIREVPVTESEQSRFGRYYIRDNFVKFWFRFIYPSLSAIEGGFFRVTTIQDKYPEYLGFVFEQIARQYLIANPVFPFTKIGRWWGQAGEIDLMAMDQETDQVLYGSCKWRDNVSAFALLQDLDAVAEQVVWRKDTRITSYILFAKSFAKTCDRFNGSDVTCVDLATLQKMMSSRTSVSREDSYKG